MADLLPWHASQWNKVNTVRELGRLPHALLMTGPAGLGKLAFARLLANGLVCDSSGTQGLPCGECRHCRLVAAGSHPDIKEINPEEDGKAIKVDAVRKMVDQSVLSVEESRYRVFIVHPSEAMGVAAANALLKTLEEPIERTLIILLCSNPGQLLATIKSRCQQLIFTTPSSDIARSWLSGQLGKDKNRITDLLRLARGAPMLARQMAERDELHRYDQLLKDFLLLAGRGAEPVAVAEKWQKQQDLKLLLGYLKQWLLEIIRLGNDANAVERNTSPPAGDLKTLANRLDLICVYQMLDKLFETERRMTNNINPQLALEQILLHWIKINKTGVA